MATITGIQHEYASELKKTSQILKALKEEHKKWKPHEKSMEMGQLANHIVDLQTWYDNALKNDSYDLKNDCVPIQYGSFKELNEILTERVEANIKFVEKTDDAFWFQNFTLTMDDRMLVKLPRVAFLRSILTNHLIHHRGQLTVYLRLLDIHVPGIYGPSADEK